jgi:hypothetical protein
MTTLNQATSADLTTGLARKNSSVGAWRALTVILLIGVAVVMLMPFVWLVSSSL